MVLEKARSREWRASDVNDCYFPEEKPVNLKQLLASRGELTSSPPPFKRSEERDSSGVSFRTVLTTFCTLIVFVVLVHLDRRLPLGSRIATPPLSLDHWRLKSKGGDCPEQVYVSLADPGRLRVSWVEPQLSHVRDTEGISYIRYGYSPDELFYEINTTGLSYSTPRGYSSGLIFHALLGSPHPGDPAYLRPGKTLYYSVGPRPSEAALSSNPSLKLCQSDTLKARLPPGPGVFPLRLGLVGDLGQTYHSMATLDHLFNGTKPQVVLAPGDLSYADGEQIRWDSWGRFVDPVFSAIPLMTLPGNHEIEDASFFLNPGIPPFTAYNSRYGSAMPYAESGSSSPLWYSFTAGPAHVIMLSSYSDFSESSPQYAWFLADVARVDRRITPWVIASFHAPWYNSNTAHQGEPEGEGMRAVFEPAFRQFGVDLAFAGHVHAYERTAPVFQGKVDPCGTAHVVIGDGGNREGLAGLFLYPKPEWSLNRDASYGHGSLDLLNATHARWTWFRNDDGVGVPHEAVYVVRSAACAAKRAGGALLLGGAGLDLHLPYPEAVGNGGAQAPATAPRGAAATRRHQRRHWRRRLLGDSDSDLDPKPEPEYGVYEYPEYYSDYLDDYYVSEFSSEELVWEEAEEEAWVRAAPEARRRRRLQWDDGEGAELEYDDVVFDGMGDYEDYLDDNKDGEGEDESWEEWEKEWEEEDAEEEKEWEEEEKEWEEEEKAGFEKSSESTWGEGQSDSSGDAADAGGDAAAQETSSSSSWSDPSEDLSSGGASGGTEDAWGSDAGDAGTESVQGGSDLDSAAADGSSQEAQAQEEGRGDESGGAGGWIQEEGSDEGGAGGASSDASGAVSGSVGSADDATGYGGAASDEASSDPHPKPFPESGATTWDSGAGAGAEGTEGTTSSDPTPGVSGGSYLRGESAGYGAGAGGAASDPGAATEVQQEQGVYTGTGGESGGYGGAATSGDAESDGSWGGVSGTVSDGSDSSTSSSSESYASSGSSDTYGAAALAEPQGQQGTEDSDLTTDAAVQQESGEPELYGQDGNGGSTGQEGQGQVEASSGAGQGDPGDPSSVAPRGKGTWRDESAWDQEKEAAEGTASYDTHYESKEDFLAKTEPKAPSDVMILHGATLSKEGQDAIDARREGGGGGGGAGSDNASESEDLWGSDWDDLGEDEEGEDTEDDEDEWDDEDWGDDWFDDFGDESEEDDEDEDDDDPPPNYNPIPIGAGAISSGRYDGAPTGTTGYYTGGTGANSGAQSSSSPLVPTKPAAAAKATTLPAPKKKHWWNVLTPDQTASNKRKSVKPLHLRNAGGPWSGRRRMLGF